MLQYVTCCWNTVCFDTGASSVGKVSSIGGKAAFAKVYIIMLNWAALPCVSVWTLPVIFFFLVSWTWWDWPLTWFTDHHPSVLWHCWLGHVTRKTVSKMTYNVSSGTLNSTIPIPVIFYRDIPVHLLLLCTIRACCTYAVHMYVPS